MSTITAATSVTINPLEPVLSTMARDQVLQVVGGGDTLALSGAQEIVRDWVSVVAEADLNWALEAVNITAESVLALNPVNWPCSNLPVIASPLVRLMLPHERNELLGGPALCLKVIIIRG